jgi:uncharacterized sulfatase
VPDLVSLIDLPPTILTLGGVTPPAHMRGHALQSLADSFAENRPDDVFLQISESQCGRAVRTKKWKYSVRAPHTRGNVPGSKVYVEDFLYDLEVDPHERQNLVTSPNHGEVRKSLAGRLIQHMVEIGEVQPTILPKHAEKN